MNTNVYVCLVSAIHLCACVLLCAWMKSVCRPLTMCMFTVLWFRRRGERHVCMHVFIYVYDARLCGSLHVGVCLCQADFLHT